MRSNLVNGLKFARWATALTLAACLSWTVGCTGDEGPKTATGHESTGPESHDSHEGHDHAEGEGHDHEGHDHGAMGKFGGHVVVLDPGHVHAEWVHKDDAETLEVYVIDNPEAVTGVKLVVETTGKDPETFELAADDTLEAPGYSVKSPNALTGISMADGEASKATLIVTTAEGEMSVSLTDDHSHDHAHDEDGH